MNKFERLIEGRWSTLKAGALGALLGAGALQGIHQMNKPSTPNQIDIQQTITAPSNKPNQKHLDFVKMAMDYIKQNEGVDPIKKPDLSNKPGTNVIGIGHNLLPGEKFGSLSPIAIEQLFKKDLVIHIARARQLLPKFDQYPNEVRVAILDGVFRGDLPISPKTLNHMRNNKWTAAAQEYLTNKEYTLAKKGIKNPGVATRMERNAKIFANYGQETGT